MAEIEWEAVPDLIAAARKIEAGQGNRKQHLVPATYLQRWQEDGQIRVTDIQLNSTYCVRPENAARETDFYRLEADEIDPDEVPPLALEVLLGHVEGRAKPGIDALIEGRELTPEEGAYVAWFIGMQFTRGRAFRAWLRAGAHEIAKAHLVDMDEADVRARLLSVGADASPDAVREGMKAVANIATDEWTVTPGDAALAGYGVVAADQVVPYLLTQRHWLVYETPPLLVTCDEPVVTLGGPGLPRAEQAGIGVAPRIIFPLSPTKLLVLLGIDLDPEGRLDLDHVELADINRELMANSNRWVFERPSRRIGSRMQVPAQQAPLVNRLVEGSREEGRELYRQHRPSRWASAPTTPWPVERWWSARPALPDRSLLWT